MQYLSSMLRTGRHLTTLGTIVLLASNAAAWAAETPSSAQPAQSQPGQSSPAQTPPKNKGAAAAPELPGKTKMAVKLAGLMTFVAGSCPDLQPDYARFRSALGVLGVSTADLEKTELKGSYLSYMMRYKEDVAGSCARALKDFGPKGSVVANLVKPREK